MMWARGVWAVSLCRSTTRCPTPYRDKATDKASPAGPAPTISTGTSTVSEPEIDIGRLHLGASPVGWCRAPLRQLISQESTEQEFIDILSIKRYLAKISYASGVATTPATRTEQVYEILRAELLNGDLRPSQKLKMVELTERFGVSQSVIREALTRLTEQGLLVATPQRGFRVRDLSIQDIAELTETRVQVESLALRLAVERGDLQWETGILAAHHRLERTPVTREDGTVSEDWSVQHRDFHQALLTGCGNRRLESVANSLRDSAELYRRWYWVLTDDHQRDLAREHRELKDLALAREAVRAIEVLTEHIDRAPSLLIAYAREHGLDDLTPPAPQDQARQF